MGWASNMDDFSTLEAKALHNVVDCVLDNNLAGSVAFLLSKQTFKFSEHCPHRISNNNDF